MSIWNSPFFAFLASEPLLITPSLCWSLGNIQKLFAVTLFWYLRLLYRLLILGISQCFGIRCSVRVIYVQNPCDNQTKVVTRYYLKCFMFYSYARLSYNFCFDKMYDAPIPPSWVFRLNLSLSPSLNFWPWNSTICITEVNVCLFVCMFCMCWSKNYHLTKRYN